MSVPVRDVHVYDGKCDKSVKIKHKFTKEDKIKLFGVLKTLLTDKTAISGLDLITNSIESPPNYDNSNNEFADDILAELCYLLAHSKDLKIDSSDLINNISEQLRDMYDLGKCPQGRCTRLWQLFWSFYEQSIYNKSDFN